MQWRALSLIFVAVLAGCGKSGDHPEFFPEVRFLVAPLGGQVGTTFEVEVLASGSASHEFPNRQFVATQPASFFLENAAPPYKGRFTWIAGAEADVILIVSGRTSQVAPLRLGPANPTIELATLGAQPDAFAISPGDPEVRLEVSSSPGGLFLGTIGDFFLSYNVGLTLDADPILVPRAPAIIFFEDARDTVSAVFRNPSGFDLTIDLYLDGVLRESDTSDKDAIIKRDI
jgi:hypothetical protein